jgi:mRNA-degrading endonuclease RelE of RelBE toxin-antitoxin system
MDKITKFLKKLSKKEALLVQDILEKIYKNEKGLYIKKLKGHHDVYRVRIKTIRVMFRKVGDRVHVFEITRRSEDTYKDF